MSDFILSQEHKNVLNRVGTLSNFVYDDVNSATQSLIQTIVENIIHFKSSILVVPKATDRHLLKEQLISFGLKDAMIACDPNVLVSEDDLSFIRTHISNEPTFNSQIDSSSYQFSKLDAEILTNFKILCTKVFGDKTWKQLLYLYLSFDQDDRIYLLHTELSGLKFEFNQKEFDEIYQSLSEVLYLYERDFELTDESGEKLGFKQEFLSEDKLQDVTYDLFTFKEMAQNIRNRYYTCLYEIEQNKKSEILAIATSLQDDLDFLSFKVDQFQHKYPNVEKKKGVFSVFSSADKSLENEKANLLNEAKSIIDLLKQHKITENISLPLQLTDIPLFIESATTLIKKFTDKIDDKVALYLKSSNRLNAKAQELEALEVDFKSIIESINKSGIFLKPFELNTLSFRKQVDCISQLVYDIDVMLLRVDKNLAYYRWKSIYLSLDIKTQKIVDILRKIDPQDWLAVFESWYYYEILNIHKNIGKLLEDSILDEVIKHNENKCRTRIFQALNLWKANHSTIYDELKKSNNKLYTSINKRKKYPDDIYWKHMLEENASFFSKLFPILIVDSDDLKNIPSGFYTELFYLDPKETNAEILQDYQTIHTYLDSNRVGDFKGDVHLTDMSTRIVQKIADYGMSERMPAIRNTVQCLLSFDKNPVIYHLRNASIVSFSNENIHTHLERSLHHFGIKRIVSEESISDTLIATLLDVKKTVFVIIDDYLLNSDQIGNYLQQRQKINAIRIAGCKIINIDHNVLMKNGVSLLDDISENIASVNAPKTDHKNQIEFEFN